MMLPLDKNLRKKLETTIKEARDIAEEAARAALNHLGVGQPNPDSHLSDEEKELRRRLRVHGRQLGDQRKSNGEQQIDRLIEEVAYEHWHRMLFARFLAENNLLMYPDPDDPVAVTLDECEDLAADEGAANGWELAARFAARMLPQIFRLDSPVFQLTLPPEHQQKLERLVADLELSVFTASDSLGWVYQFWQAKKKDEVNASEVKIGSRELPAVTQLFTEPYMVSFLLDNSLGAWWAARRLTEDDLKNASSEEELREKAAIPGVPLDYLRFVKVEAASSRLKEFGYFHNDDEITNLSGNLPHWRQDGVTYFVTFRTADSLPQEKLKQWQKEKDEWLKQHPEPHDEEVKREFYEKFPERIQKWLDQGHGACLLGNTEYKAIVEGALRHFDGDRYDLDEYVVMPNHVHVIVTPNSHPLSEILHSWKSFTASQINKKAGSSGAFWQKESFDHIVRSPAQLEKIRSYIRHHLAYEKKRQDAASTFTWTPAAGTFDGWPDNLSELKTLDPCCGSGHFLVAAFLMLVPMRMELEGLSAREAVDAVLRENIHGLELDQRCVELAAFALALTAWKYPSAGGYRVLPELNVACSGLSVSVAKEEWKQLGSHIGGGKKNLSIALDWLHDTFQDAPVLGSLLNPAKTDAAKLVQWDELSSALEQALKQEQSPEQKESQQEIAVVAQGLARAATLLAGRYQWVMTNVPYLARGKQNERLRDFCERYYPEAKNDLATVFLDRCLELCVEVEEPSRLFDKAAGSRFYSGTVSVVLPQNWLFLTSYKKFREKLLKNDTWHLIARLGPQAFQTPMWDFNVQLISLSRGNANVEEASSLFKRQDAASTLIRGIDVSGPRTAAEKAAQLLTGEIKSVEQAKQLENPDARVAFDDVRGDLLEKYAGSFQGIKTGDDCAKRRFYWEQPSGTRWVPYLSTVDNTISYGGFESVIDWVGKGHDMARLQGVSGWNKQGIAVSQMRHLPVALFKGTKFDSNISALPVDNPTHLPAIWCFCSSPDYNEAVRRIDQKLNVTNATLVKVPFDLDHWTKVAAEKYPNGLPKPYTDDPTQWIFHGHPCGSVIWNEKTKRLEAAATLRTDETVLQVAVARLLGYRWPAEGRSGFQPLSEDTRQDGASIELADEQREWVKRCEALSLTPALSQGERGFSLVDEDGIVCIPPVRGEASASDRLLNLLAAAYNQNGGDAWSNDTLAALLKSADHAGKTLESWLREKFFTQHCKLFQHRPFIWHIWDGLRDGFAALVNYHKLDAKLLETLIYTYLGDWISRCKVEAASSRLDDVKRQDGASTLSDPETKLAAAEALKKKLELILEGEGYPDQGYGYDIFVRWKPLEQQPIGWDPDLNDGVRLNIRPFLSVPDVGKKGAGVLRDKPNINWNKDRGKDVESAPWYHVFNGDRINDHHLTLAEKRAARGG
jgi:REP element-mobilizing transposase RayT